MLAQNAQEEASAAVEMSQSVRRVSALENLHCLDEPLQASPPRRAPGCLTSRVSRISPCTGWMSWKICSGSESYARP